ncbi:related to Vacuolar protein sorting-associated protein 75 [Saccharomycodes ludwigii]|uniref:Related to Vacuolar protein sorting-associated protein 75 n=1 Tax=Saccharomycodes ludwigii TaxID=36035 RepID=A0A376B1B8_9ASCO|nr:hypothetical protein SCDLUD_003928 [Saccharomycodes ludwigii]KAH3899647.1 hypothetical protein SCDLUD_003928 [Saccharomycodes ludwigii]SSD58486.1 related to Vacuolar protein sorting-associated protein 75 [Saccharomycodes ludwigii]
MLEQSKLSNALKQLADIEDDMEKIDEQVELFRLKSTIPIFKKRNMLLQDIPGFWKIVLSEHSDFADFIQVSDFKYVDCIDKIEINWPIVSEHKSTEKHKVGDFDIVFHFKELKEDDDMFPEQTVTKKFRIEYDTSKLKKLPKDQDEDSLKEFGFLTSEKVDIEWPTNYSKINPDKIKDKTSAEGKKNYRAGMKSFFGWFRWTGLKPGKEFPHGDDLATLFSEDIYPHALKYYTTAHRDLDDESDEEDEKEGYHGYEDEDDETLSRKKPKYE